MSDRISVGGDHSRKVICFLGVFKQIQVVIQHDSTINWQALYLHIRQFLNFLCVSGTKGAVPRSISRKTQLRSRLEQYYDLSSMNLKWQTQFHHPQFITILMGGISTIAKWYFFFMRRAVGVPRLLIIS